MAMSKIDEYRGAVNLLLKRREGTPEHKRAVAWAKETLHRIGFINKAEVKAAMYRNGCYIRDNGLETRV